MNPLTRLNPKDRNAIKGSLRRAFARSDLHKAVIEAAIVPWSDPLRPKVKVWVKCAICAKPEAKSYMVVDHIDPVIPVTTSFENLGADVTIDRMWCELSNLQAACPDCHDIKTAAEKEERKKYAPPRAKRAPRKKACAKT